MRTSPRRQWCLEYRALKGEWCKWHLTCVKANGQGSPFGQAGEVREKCVCQIMLTAARQYEKLGFLCPNKFCFLCPKQGQDPFCVLRKLPLLQHEEEMEGKEPESKQEDFFGDCWRTPAKRWWWFRPRWSWIPVDTCGGQFCNCDLRMQNPEGGHPGLPSRHPEHGC